MARHVLAIDAGTTGVRAAVFDEAASPCGRAYRELSMSYPAPGYVEQDPTELADSTRAVVAESLAAAGLAAADIAAIGVTNQRSSVVAWDGPTGAPLSPILSWQDTRAADRCTELLEEGLFVTPMMAASKAEWIVRNVPAAAEAARAGRLRLGMPNSWVVASLCGDVNVCDHGNASVTGFYEHVQTDWDPKLLGALGMEPQWLPKLVSSSAPMATTSAERFGAEVVVAGMAGDQQASLFGLACLKSGQTKCSYGTSAMVTTSTEANVAIGGAGTYPVLAWRTADGDTWCVEGNVVTAGAAVQWLRDGLGLVTDASETGALAASVDDAGGVWAVPSFQGLGTPLMAEKVRALLGGVSRSTGRAHIVRAVLEGVAQRVCDVAESVGQAGEAPAVLRADGGAARNDFLMQTQADLLGIPVERSSVVEGAALGAAKLAGMGVGLWSGADELASLWEAERVFEPAMGAEERAESRATWSRRVELAVSAAE